MLLDWIHQIDIAILLFIQEYVRIEALNGFWTTVTSLGNLGWFWIMMGLFLLVFPKTRKAGFTALFAMAVGALVTNLFLKQVVARVRPYDRYEEIILLVLPQKDYSFPSGHTCAAFASAFIYLWRLSKPWGMLGIGLAALIAFSRLYVGVHYPSDVLGGFAIGYLSAWFADWCLYRKDLQEPS